MMKVISETRRVI